MSTSRTASRVAVVSSILVGVGVLAVSPSFASSVPSEPDPTAEAAADASSPGRDDVVDAIISSAAASNVEFDRECVTGIVDQIPEGELGAVFGQVTADAADAATVDISLPDFSLPDISDVSLTDFSDITMPVVTLSPETDALGSQLLSCLTGDADPALVDQAATLIAQQPDNPGLDVDCLPNVLRTLDDSTLSHIIANGGVLDLSGDVTDPGGTVPENMYLLFACFTFDLNSSVPIVATTG